MPLYYPHSYRMSLKHLLFPSQHFLLFLSIQKYAIIIDTEVIVATRGFVRPKKDEPKKLK